MCLSYNHNMQVSFLVKLDIIFQIKFFAEMDIAMKVPSVSVTKLSLKRYDSFHMWFTSYWLLFLQACIYQFVSELHVKGIYYGQWVRRIFTISCGTLDLTKMIKWKRDICVIFVWYLRFLSDKSNSLQIFYKYARYSRFWNWSLSNT